MNSMFLEHTETDYHNRSFFKEGRLIFKLLFKTCRFGLKIVVRTTEQ